MRILIDTLGSDRGVSEIVKGAMEAAKEKSFTPVFIGNSSSLSSVLNSKDNYEIIEANDVINNDEEPAMAVRRKKGSSIVVGGNLLKTDSYDGMFSCGSTGGLLACGLFIVGRIKGIERAAISVFLPKAKGHVLLLDCGANVDSKPEMLLQFAIMGASYAEFVQDIKNPKVALLNVGAERGKGNALTQEAFELLNASDLNFIGNIEGRDIFNTGADVICADGFSGNVLLKTLEGTAMFLMDEFKKVFLKSGKNKLGGLLIKNDMKELKNKLDYRSVGGAPLLGLKKPLFKGHGSSDSVAVYNGILQLCKFIERDVISEIEKKLTGGIDNERESN